MTRDFPDELFSAFIDDELSPAERDQVERHLASNEPARQLVAELQSLRSEVASLPPVAVGDDFADRILAAALEEAEKNGMAIGPISVPESAKVDPTAAHTGSTAAIVPEPGLAGIILAETE